MIVLDTNVISELMRREPDPRVMAWIAEQPMAGVFTTTLTQADIFYGLALLPEGRRRDDLLPAARPMFDGDLAGRVLPFSSEPANRPDDHRLGNNVHSPCRSRLWSHQ